jgi:hypothetical protein
MRFAFAAILWTLPTASGLAAEIVEFNRDIRPILADVCYHCHGPDQAHRKAGLRLDVEESAKEARKGHAAIVPGSSAKSELIRRITAEEPAVHMPPPDSGRHLTPAQADLLRQWVEQGAKWQKHWAFIPPKTLEPPAVVDAKWVRNPIDRIVLDRLEKEGLRPSPEAARMTLIRRVTLDLTGVPPTPEEVDAFLRDRSTDAYEKVVDRLLASPRYGERMAWRWLEAARYADTHGYQTDGEREMWRWRDWVIDAYNRNVPFDQFTTEQLAGDLLPNPTLDQRIATGFNRNHRGNSEGGIIPEEYAVEYVVDRVETTATVWLGLTLGCARCHDHKYDPFTQKEFYQLYAYFNSIPEKGRAVKYGNSPPFIKAPTKEQQRQRDALAQLLREAEERFKGKSDEIKGALRTWLEVAERPLPNWTVEGGWHANLNRDGNQSEVSGPALTARSLTPDSSVEFEDVGDFGFNDRFTIAFWIKPQGDGAVVGRTVPEQRGEGYSFHLVNGRLQVHLTKRWLDDALRVETEDVLPTGEWRHVVVRYNGSRSAAGTEMFINGKLAKMKVLLDELNQDFRTTQPFRVGALAGEKTGFRGVLGNLRIYPRWLHNDEVEILATAETLERIANKAESSRTHGESSKLFQYFLSEVAPESIRSLHQSVLVSREKLRLFDAALPTVMVMEELPRPVGSFVLVRGEYDKRGEKVSRSVPATLNPFPKDSPQNRLGLAKWLVDPTNPLTARVAVNRAWQLHFGVGLVRTGEDFGTQGEYPTHPELLDWLATEFVRTGWDLKRLHKLIVTSATYRQSSRVPNELATKDPDNRLLARGPRYRLSAEVLRDQALFTSGLLVEKRGGPSVKPYQPPGLWMELTGADDYKADTGANLYRRSLYTFWKRTVAPPTLATFDAAGRETCSVREVRTNTPLQALNLLNDVTYVEAARMLAQRVLKEAGPTSEARLQRAFRLVLSRPPTAAEARILNDSLAHSLRKYRTEPAAARKLLAVGEAKADPKLDVAELAAYAALCSLILNLDETLTKE